MIPFYRILMRMAWVAGAGWAALMTFPGCSREGCFVKQTSGREGRILMTRPLLLSG